MSNYFCRLAYLGAAYYGFERQKSHPTIQGKVEECLAAILGEKVSVNASGRTDAKVNAKGQTFSFRSSSSLPKDEAKFLFAMNRVLPSDISLLSINEVSEDFHARYSAKKKRYSYSFLLGEKDPFLAFEVAMLGNRAFDSTLFEKACKIYLGEHNFQDFTPKSEDLQGFKRTILEVSPLEKENGIYRISFTGNGFMTYQVRTMVGLALKVGWGKVPLEEVSNRLDSEERKILSYKAPAEGLCLEEVIYD